MGDVESLIVIVLLGDVDLDAVVGNPLVHLLGPVLDALLLAVLAQLRQHNDDGAFLLGYHSPKVFYGIGKRGLSGNKGPLLVIAI